MAERIGFYPWMNQNIDNVDSVLTNRNYVVGDHIML